METFGNKLRVLRIRLGLSQQQVADQAIDISQPCLSALENRSKAPRQEILEMLNEFYGVDNTYWQVDTEGIYTLNKHEEMVVESIRRNDYSKAIEILNALKILDDTLKGLET